MPRPVRQAAWKKAVNDVLRRTTGYQLERVVPSTDVRSAHARGPVTEPKSGRRRAGGSGPRQVRVPDHYDEWATELIRRVTPRTMTSPVKLFALVQSVRYVVAAGVAGDVVECGVWRGGSHAWRSPWTLIRRGTPPTGTSTCYDTFDRDARARRPRDVDARPRRRQPCRAACWKRHGANQPVWACAVPAATTCGRTAMGATGYPAERIAHTWRGWWRSTIPKSGAPERLAVLRLDTDWYASTRHELAHLYRRLQPRAAS